MIKNPEPEKPYNPERLEGDLVWEPLYIFLREIFEERYKDVASGFMYVGSLKLFGDIVVYNYKHGITRRSLLLMIDGTSLRLATDRRKHVSESGVTIYEDYLPHVLIESLQESYNYVFSDIEKMYGGTCDVFTKYNDDFRQSRDILLKNLGYEVISVNTTDSLETIGQTLKQSYEKDN